MDTPRVDEVEPLVLWMRWFFVFFFSSRRRHTSFKCDWSSDVCSSDLVAGKVTGVLSVGHPTPRDFTEREVALLQGFADQAAIAINNAQTQEALATQAERLRILHEIDRALIAEQAPVAIAEAVVFPLRDLLGVPRVIVNLFDEE